MYTSVFCYCKWIIAGFVLFLAAFLTIVACPQQTISMPLLDSHHLCLSFCLRLVSLMIRSNSWLCSAISPTPAPNPSSPTSGNSYSCHLLSQMTLLSFQLPSQHPSHPQSRFKAKTFFSVSGHSPNLMDTEMYSFKADVCLQSQPSWRLSHYHCSDVQRIADSQYKLEIQFYVSVNHPVHLSDI